MIMYLIKTRRGHENETRYTRCAKRGFDGIAGNRLRIGRPLTTRGRRVKQRTLSFQKSTTGSAQADDELGRMTSRPQVADPVFQHGALTKLSETSVDLNASLTTMEMKKAHLGFCSFSHKSSFLSVGGLTMPELALLTSQDFIGTFSDLDKPY
ncbi:hypothetical protein CORC01_04663 [Colletotrichum orchidophilum]|uniref:Uncharacterized protein n=1 Tax=Colletotrichum orchidophilum TaxID=1209926 RepID=A0A1G4BF81_9PEZI|nr:uncharacterized protein CORC01_04663 [Colletotrichum orchidophilum]OHF00017.1 hypothetical protein CORC01_04663 [Colletotrichum orchidophilum]